MGLTLKIEGSNETAVLEFPPLFADKISTPDEFKRFALYVLQAANISPFDNYAYTLLPLVNTLSGQWRCSSPPGMESTTPPVGWEFKERMDMCVKHPNELPILVIKDTDGMPMNQLIKRISSDIFDAYGLGVVNTVQTKTKDPEWLNDALGF